MSQENTIGSCDNTANNRLRRLEAVISYMVKMDIGSYKIAWYRCVKNTSYSH